MKSDCRSARRILRAAILFLVCCGWSVSANAEEFGDIQVIPESSRSDNNGTHGYALYHFMVSNRSSTKTHEVELRIPGNSYMSTSGSRIHRLSKKFKAAPNSTVYVPLYQPAVRMTGDGVGVYINGREQNSSIALRRSDHGAYTALTASRTSSASAWTSVRSGMFEPRVLISYSADESDLRRIASLSPVGLSASPSVPPSPGFTGGSPPGFTGGPTVTIRPSGVARTVSGPSNVKLIHASGFESNWLSYSSYDGCVLALSDAQGLAPNELSALWQYIECGGSVAVMGDGSDGKLPEAWAALDPQLANRKLDNNTFERYRVGMGFLFLSGPPDQLLANNQPAASAIAESWTQSGHTWGTLPTASGANASLEMVKPLDSQASLRQMFIAMLAFAVLIGPVNLIVLAKRKRRSWVFWTTPAVSALACAAVFLYAALAEGWGQHTRYAYLTTLDPEVNRAATIGMVGFYSPMSHSSGLMFEDSTEVTPLIAGSPVSGSVDWTKGQHFKGDWVQARIPRHFKLRKNETRRERINLVRDGGQLSIVNGIGADIKSIVYRAHDGRRYQASGISKGEKAPLSEISNTASASVSLREAYANRDWYSSIKSMRDNPLQYLEPGWYIAELEENVFVEEALDGARVKPSIAMLTGEASE